MGEGYQHLGRTNNMLSFNARHQEEGVLLVPSASAIFSASGALKIVSLLVFCMSLFSTPTQMARHVPSGALIYIANIYSVIHSTWPRSLLVVSHLIIT